MCCNRKIFTLEDKASLKLALGLISGRLNPIELSDETLALLKITKEYDRKPDESVFDAAQRWVDSVKLKAENEFFLYIDYLFQ